MSHLIMMHSKSMIQRHPASHTAVPSEAQQAKEHLRRVSVRVTPARIEVMSLLLAQQRAMSHTELQDALPNMDRVTLYRALDCLSEAGLAHKIVGDDRVSRFRIGGAGHHPDESNVLAHEHGHFQCTRCAKVYCLDQPQFAKNLQQQLSATLAATQKQGFTTHGIELTIKGWCEHCNSESD